MKSGDIKVYSNAKEGGKGEHCKRKKKKEGKNNGVSIKKGGKIVVPYVVSIARWLISFVPLRFFPPSNVLSIRVLFENYYTRQWGGGGGGGDTISRASLAMWSKRLIEPPPLLEKGVIKTRPRQLRRFPTFVTYLFPTSFVELCSLSIDALSRGLASS